jgi:hypothetical protein
MNQEHLNPQVSVLAISYNRNNIAVSVKDSAEAVRGLVF